YATLKGIENQKIDGYLLYQWNRNSSDGKNSDLARFTVGGYGKGKFDDIDYEAELAYQGGKLKELDVAATMLTATVGYSLKDIPVSRVAVGYELYSGTPAGDTKYKSFDATFATGHKFFGFMDYFIGIPANTNNLGLADVLFRATMKVSDQGTCNFWFHNFSLAQDVNGEKGLGQEIDLTYLCKYNSNLNFELGASTFIPGEMMRTKFGGADAAFWGYLSTSVHF
ncbi:MAG: alginate export family protein, partial [Ignavibacteriae bacterium]|nr:alginate export family protein [Ignavibacteriota bacterium]